MKGKTRVTGLGRLVALSAVLAVGVVAGATGASATRPHGQAWRCALIRPGDTLWDLSRQVAPKKDPRATVDRIVDHNHLATSVIHPGTALWVPWDGTGSIAETSACIGAE